MNQFTERYRSKERRNMRSTEVLSLVIEFNVEEEENVREMKKKGAPMRLFIDRRAPS
jgi:hypothetical protein